ncbi:MAG: PLP-dependent aminotransferase family protein [Lachnospiraceae bacterium]|nr:PLP-dependent aminotransferase family protein [Lachnospiraceae bacterium]
MSSRGKGAKIPLYRRISEEIRRDILSGIYESGEILPSIRDKARILGVARNTVDTAYQILAEEGYIRGKRGVGYEVLDYRQSFNFEVSDDEPVNETLLRARCGSQTHMDTAPHTPGCDRETGSGNPSIPVSGYICDFRGGIKPAGFLTEKDWTLLAVRIYRELQSTPAEAMNRLRKQIRRYLKRHRGISCREEQIFLFRDLHQAVQMIRKVQPNIVYTIPHHEGRMGNHISPEESKALLRRYSENGIYIVEDDIDSELVYDRRPYATLYQKDTENRVILTGTFERILHLNTQHQYVVFPTGLIDENRKLFAAMEKETHHSLLEINCLEVMMKSDKWEHFLRKTNHSYAAKRDLLLAKLREYFGDHASFYMTESGPEIIAVVPFGGDFSAFLKEAEREGLGITARTGISRRSDGKKLYISLHYAALSEDEIAVGIDLLAGVLRVVNNP